MDSKQLSILNALVTFAAENMPGGLSEEEREVAQIVGRFPTEERLFENIPMQLNLSDYQIGSHLGWAAAFKSNDTGTIRLDIRLSPEASKRLDKDLAKVFDVYAIGFAGIMKKAEPTKSVSADRLEESLKHELLAEQERQTRNEILYGKPEPLADETFQKSLDITGVKVKKVEAKDLKMDTTFMYGGFLYTVIENGDQIVKCKPHSPDLSYLHFYNPEFLSKRQVSEGSLPWTTEVIVDDKSKAKE